MKKLIIIWLLNLFDYIMTIYYVGKYGLSIEVNPFMREMLSISPLFAGFIKMTIATGTCVFCYIVKDYKIIKIATWVLLVFYAWVAVNHLLLPILPL